MGAGAIGFPLSPRGLIAPMSIIAPMSFAFRRDCFRRSAREPELVGRRPQGEKTNRSNESVQCVPIGFSVIAVVVGALDRMGKIAR